MIIHTTACIGNNSLLIFRNRVVIEVILKSAIEILLSLSLTRFLLLCAINSPL